MSDRDEHLEVLRAIWAEMKTLNGRINDVRDTLSARIDIVATRIDAMDEHMDARFADLKDVVTMGRLDRKRLDRLERRVDALERRER
jgi:hypothetical protein